MSARTKAFWKNLCLRAQWGAKRRDGWGDRTAYYPLKYCFLHHTVAGEVSANATVAEEMAHMRKLEQIGWERFGGTVSYPLVVFRSGRAYQGLSFSRVGAHTKGYNTAGFAIVLVGDYTSQRPSAAQERTIADALEALKEEGILAAARITNGHRDVFPTSCPGQVAYGRIGAINSLVGKSSPVKPVDSKPVASDRPTGSKPWPKAYLTVTGRRNKYQDKSLKKLLGDVGYKGTLAMRLQRHLRAKGYYKGYITWRSNIGPQTIQAWQGFLKDRGYYTGAITRQSQWGPQTTEATVRFLNDQARDYYPV